MDSKTDIENFIRANGLDIDLLDERDEALEDWRLKWKGLAKGFVNYLQDRFASIEQRLDGWSNWKEKGMDIKRLETVPEFRGNHPTPRSFFTQHF